MVTGKMVDRAGDLVRSPEASESALLEAKKVLADWRDMHDRPLMAVAAWIGRLARPVQGDAVVALRLKRMPSIVAKIRRFPAMKASRMQDYAGLRVILGTVGQVDLLNERISASRSRHRPALLPRDYIAAPKPDGYRGLHRILRYAGTRHPALEGVPVELQLRTRLQHAWATAVEILEIVEKAPFKSGGGDGRLRRFMLLASALFAIDEGQPVPEACAGVPQTELLRELDALDGELHACARLEALSVSVRTLFPGRARAGDCFLLELGLKGGGRGTLDVQRFARKHLPTAEAIYLSLEEMHRDDPSVQVLLMSAPDAARLRPAYPNYHLDASMFLDALARIRAGVRAG